MNFVRVIPFLPGQLLAKARHTLPVLHRLGAVIATADCGLARFNHPAAERHLTWDLANA